MLAFPVLLLMLFSTIYQSIADTQLLPALGAIVLSAFATVIIAGVASNVLVMVISSLLHWDRGVTSGEKTKPIYLWTALGSLSAIVLMIPLIKSLGFGSPDGEKLDARIAVTQENPSLGKIEEPWMLRTVDGKSFNFRRFEGKVIFLTLTTTFSEANQKELLSIQALKNSIEENDVEFVVVTPDNEQAVRNFQTEKNVDLTMLILEKTPPAIFQTQALPATFILNARGEIVRKQLGTANWDTHSVRSFLKNLR